MKLKDFYIENKSQIRLNFENGISRIVPTSQLDIYLNPEEINQIKKAIKLKHAYLRKFPHWLKAWGLVSVGALVLLSSSSRAHWKSLPKPASLIPALVHNQSQSVKPSTELPPKTPNQPTKTNNSTTTESVLATGAKNELKSQKVNKISKFMSKKPLVKSKQSNPRPNHEL